MASLMKKLFDTMPLAGVEGAIRDTDGSLKGSTVGRVARHLKFYRTLTAIDVKSPRPSPEQLKHFSDRWDRIPIWGYTVTANPARVTEVTCRTREDNFNNYVVLDKLEWGYAPLDAPTSFREAVQVTVQGNALELPLTEDYRLMTFLTNEGLNEGSVHWLWPLDARHDRSLLHVFVYDLHRTRSELTSLKSPAHGDRAEIDALLARCEELNRAAPADERNPFDLLFSDKLWDAPNTKGPPTGTVPENVDLSLKPIRIIVAVSLTVCRERDDFQPGRPMGVGRIYPHLMVVGTAALDRVEGGVRFTRPNQTRLLDAAHCSCDEMLPDIGSLLVDDSNDDAMVLYNIPGLSAPVPYLANLFNYYVTDPALEPGMKDTLIPMVRAAKSLPRNEVGYVDRDCSRLAQVSRLDDHQRRVTKAPRQGAFDNIHVAPKMTVRTKIDTVSLPVTVPGMERVAIKFPGYAAWKMDRVTMAPFCAHDCFHMHWRWTNNANTDSPTFGWGPHLPNLVVGQPMVPENQDVNVVLHSPVSFSYLASAHQARSDAWQPFCHHGAGYGLSMLAKPKAAKVSALLMDTMDFRDGNMPVLGDWALFYWRLRYELRAVKKTAADGTIQWDAVVRERFRFIDKAKALDL